MFSILPHTYLYKLDIYDKSIAINLVKILLTYTQNITD